MILSHLRDGTRSSTNATSYRSVNQRAVSHQLLFQYPEDCSTQVMMIMNVRSGMC